VARAEAAVPWRGAPVPAVLGEPGTASRVGATPMGGAGTAAVRAGTAAPAAPTLVALAGAARKIAEAAVL